MNHGQGRRSLVQGGAIGPWRRAGLGRSVTVRKLGAKMLQARSFEPGTAPGREDLVNARPRLDRIRRRQTTLRRAGTHAFRTQAMTRGETRSRTSPKIPEMRGSQTRASSAAPRGGSPLQGRLGARGASALGPSINPSFWRVRHAVAASRPTGTRRLSRTGSRSLRALVREGFVRGRASIGNRPPTGTGCRRNECALRHVHASIAAARGIGKAGARVTGRPHSA